MHAHKKKKEKEKRKKNGILLLTQNTPQTLLIKS